MEIEALILSLILLLSPVPTLATEQTEETEYLNRIADTIHWLVTPPDRFHEDRKRPYFGTRAYKDPLYRMELSRGFVKASKHFNLPLPLLVAIGYRESVFRLNLKGPKTELGMMQVCKYGRRKCKEYCSKPGTVEGEIACGACWLDMIRKTCGGDLLKGLAAYISGKCNPTAKRSIRALNIRLKLWAKLKEMIGGEKWNHH